MFEIQDVVKAAKQKPTLLYGGAAVVGGIIIYAIYSRTKPKPIEQVYVAGYPEKSESMAADPGFEAAMAAMFEESSKLSEESIALSLAAIENLETLTEYVKTNIETTKQVEEQVRKTKTSSGSSGGSSARYVEPEPAKIKVYGNAIDIAAAMDYLSPRQYEFVRTDDVYFSGSFDSGGIIVGGKAAEGGVSYDPPGVTRIGGADRAETRELIAAYAGGGY